MVKVIVDGKEIVYGPLVTRSRFTEEEWFAICLQMMKEERPDLYEKRKDDKEFIFCLGMAIDLEQRYEALLELLPQSTYSKAGTHPKWIADAVESNTLNKGITQDDIKTILEQEHYERDDIISEIKEYLGIEEEDE
ncbi:hypothetical protein [Enterococcus wangshanyuanii]|uniref:Phage protein n=1 Tax=Enterococcus wangshanyuanii TaxID=2005703 RepID=A0ABQ1P785_9ENTE|nr:hypothetical protein [Enterococcus wangshanyuanii]GGC88168.1 hypothetical protein GCM10011573_17210 [Enterococcus wangshanyuanii]